MLISPVRTAAALCMVAAFAIISLVLAGDVSSASTQKGAAKPDDAALRARAEKLHRASIVIDTHNDITSPLADDGFDLGTSGIEPNGTLKTHTDIKRMKEGGLTAEFFAVYVGKEFVNKKPAEGGCAARRALGIIDAAND